MRAIVLFFLISGMLTACGGGKSIDENKMDNATKLEIISSIKPIHTIVLAIAGEHADSAQLIPDYASPHDYSFKPSDIRKVKNADVIFRIDEHMETQLNAVFESLDSNTKLVSLAEIEGVKLLETEMSHHAHDNNDKNHKKHETEESDKHPEHEGVDFHIWTSPINALVIANEVAKILIQKDAKNEQSYLQNLEKFRVALEAEAKKISTALAPYKNSKYIVFHNSWQYFADEFGLQKPTVVDLHEGVSSGAKTVSEIRASIEKENIRCVFYDSSVNEGRLKLFVDKANTTEIDVLAKDIAMNQVAYITWLQQLGRQVESCLSR